MRSTLASVRQIRGERALANLGLYGAFARLDATPAAATATWLELGPGLELWQHAGHRQSLWVAVGGAIDSRFGADPVPVRFSAPVSARLHLASADAALTALDLEARWIPGAPVVTARARHLLWTGAVDGGLELGGSLDREGWALSSGVVIEPR
ncbi:MAG: hypothetical protein ABMA64_36020 [Myxococcota bacterium]